MDKANQGAPAARTAMTPEERAYAVVGGIDMAAWAKAIHASALRQIVAHDADRRAEALGRCGLEAEPHRLDQDKCVGWTPGEAVVARRAFRGTGGHCTTCGVPWDDCHEAMARALLRVAELEANNVSAAPAAPSNSKEQP